MRLTPTIDRDKHGKWAVREYQSSQFGVDREWYCTNCNVSPDIECDEIMNPANDLGLECCPNCGAKMEDER